MSSNAETVTTNANNDSLSLDPCGSIIRENCDDSIDSAVLELDSSSTATTTSTTTSSKPAFLIKKEALPASLEQTNPESGGQGLSMCAQVNNGSDCSQITTTSTTTTTVIKKVGYASIKQEFLVPDYKPKLQTAYVSSEIKEKLEDAEDSLPDHAGDPEKGAAAGDEGEPPHKKAKLKGRNKHRPKHERLQDKDRICPAIKENKECRFGDRCKFSHDKEDFISKKLPELAGSCYIYDTFGHCPYGISCRFAANHMTEDFQNKTNEEIYNKDRVSKPINELSFDVRNKLWKRKYDFKRADKVVKDVQKTFRGWDDSSSGINPTLKNVVNDKIEAIKTASQISQSDTDLIGNSNANNIPPVIEPAVLSQEIHVENRTEILSSGAAPADLDKTAGLKLPTHEKAEQRTFGCITDEEIIRLQPGEVKKIDFKNKLYLAPLTTVGNLPFRRICKTFGADITCGEMALVTQLLKGKQSEWSLIKRHPSEDLFGVQICGSYPDTMTRCAQLLTETCSVDFIDINCGCPIDLIYQKGMGSALMGKATKLEQICRSMIGVMGNTPLTVKLRTGVFDNKNVAHNILPRLRDAGVSLVTLHGRSREQRYTKLADWDYAARCAAVASPMPVFGNGDILSYEEANLHMNNHGVSGVMIARGALIKPWIFTEIKEQRHWDISSGERFDILRKFTNYGLEHWGSDHQGVENTRRFLLEWLSFLHRYIPVGVLEQVPQHINERPPYYIGRNDLETLMASANCADWIKISEMLLGPVPPTFMFLPKHKANAYQ
ncbi:unnamed protein product [Candidula unifasciata]|uniref:tRNA-dihydrouridine(47) synthase [NAD(P)(+)] n=1 Tax=Candidula unifasciata TaxID=100452 RepID=A0A8S3ZT78_9EUPU|nr:unnamed protein product [Candidula unifasciata]